MGVCEEGEPLSNEIGEFVGGVGGKLIHHILDRFHISSVESSSKENFRHCDIVFCGCKLSRLTMALFPSREVAAEFSKRIFLMLYHSPPL